MKLTKKQQIISLCVFSPLIPVVLLIQLTYGICFILSEVLDGVGILLRRLDFAIGELFLKFAKRIK
jgi:hypothetical protein